MSSFVRALFFFFEEISSPCRLKHEKKFQCLFSMLGRHLQVHHFVWRIFHENRVCLHITDWSVLTISRQFLTLGHFLWLSVHIQWFHTKYFGCFVYMCVVNSLFSTYSICYLKVEFRNITLRHYPKLQNPKTPKPHRNESISSFNQLLDYRTLHQLDSQLCNLFETTINKQS